MHALTRNGGRRPRRSGEPGRPGRWMVIALAAVAPLGMAACSSSPAPNVPVITPVTPADSQPAGNGASARLARVVLQPNDLPAGWTSKPHSTADDADSARDQRRMAHCVGKRDTDPDQVLAINSPDFSLGQTQFSSTVDSYKHHSDIKTDAALLRSPKAARCFRQIFRSEIGGILPSGAKVGRIVVHIVHRTRRQPRNVVATISASVSVTAGSQRIKGHLADVAIKGRTVEADVSGFAIGQPLPAALERRLVAAVAHRTARL